MNFRSYDKIPEKSKDWGLQPSQLKQLEKLSWVVTEKIHGANFVFLTDGRQIQCAKRKAVLQDTDSFFGFHSVLEKCERKITELFRCLNQTLPISQISVYGELFGGAYPHPEVPKIRHTQAIQTGVYYSPHIDFCAFDICVHKKGNTEPTFLDYEVTVQAFEQVGLLYAKSLFIGSFQEVLHYPVSFSSTLSTQLGFPPITDNLAEGIIIKPSKTIYFEGKKGPFRPIIKKKTAAFAEEQRFHQAQKWKSSNTTAFEQLWWECIAHITPARLDNAISKVGKRTYGASHRAKELYQLFINDVIESIEENQQANWKKLTKIEKKKLRVLIRKETRKLLSQQAPSNTLPEGLKRQLSLDKVTPAEIRSILSAQRKNRFQSIY